MFERVAILVGIGDILYDAEIFDRSGNSKQDVNAAKSYLEKLDAFDYKFKVKTTSLTNGTLGPLSITMWPLPIKVR